jgi:hypothetical protein
MRTTHPDAVNILRAAIMDALGHSPNAKIAEVLGDAINKVDGLNKYSVRRDDDDASST